MNPYLRFSERNYPGKATRTVLGAFATLYSTWTNE
jgi:hypothetical protein